MTENEHIEMAPKFSEKEIEKIIDTLENGDKEEYANLVEKYEKETGKYVIWRDNVTEGFRKWLKGEKIYNRDKDRISLYVNEDKKDKWQKFIKEHDISTISKLIRQSVSYYINQQSRSIKDDPGLNAETFATVSHALKEPLTTIKGFSQLLLENYREELRSDVLEKIENIFEQSQMLESKIKAILEDIRGEPSNCDILLIEDDLATIRLLTSYFESKGLKIEGIVSGTKGIEKLKHSDPKVILLDIILPDISGYEICKLIKNDKDLSETPVYLLTAIPGSEVEKKIDEVKADGYILKPFDFSDFKPIFKYLNL
ncbi:MAG: Signal transduction response regulator [Promethearchaeota archaeon]|nr:MAG: Signal transduction response regulator [Candidatus Lokiarchaeota archaeon]